MARKQDTKTATLMSVYELPNDRRTKNIIAKSVGISHVAEGKILTSLIEDGYLTSKTTEELTEYILTEKGEAVCRDVREKKELLYAHFVNIHGFSLDEVNTFIENTADDVPEILKQKLQKHIASRKKKFEKCICSLRDGEYTIPFNIYMMKNGVPTNELSMAHPAFKNPADLIVENGKIKIQMYAKQITRMLPDGTRAKGKPKSLVLIDDSGSQTPVEFVKKKYFVIPFEKLNEKHSSFLTYTFVARAAVSVKAMRDVEAVMAIKFNVSGVVRKVK